MNLRDNNRPACAFFVLVIAFSAAIASVPGATAIAGERLQARQGPTLPHASRPVHIDPRLAEFKRELAGYKRTVAALRRDSKSLKAQQHRLDALARELSSDAEIDMVQLQSLASQRQIAVQLSTNLAKSLSKSESAIIHNMK